MERPLVLPYRREGIYAVLHAPACFAQAARRAGVLMVHAEGGSKSGHKRSFVELGRRLEAGGVAALRFDLLGEGESEELLEDPFLAWRGLRPTTDYFHAEWRLDRLVLLGDCFGGLLATHYARLDPRVDQVVVWNLAQVKWTAEQLEGFAGQASPALEDVRHYFHKLATREAWAKLVSFRLHARELLRRAVVSPARSLALAGWRGLRRSAWAGRPCPAETTPAAGRRVPVTVLHAEQSPATARTLAIARHVFARAGFDVEHRVLPGREFSSVWKEAAYGWVQARAVAPRRATA